MPGTDALQTRDLSDVMQGLIEHGGTGRGLAESLIATLAHSDQAAPPDAVRKVIDRTPSPLSPSDLLLIADRLFELAAGYTMPGELPEPGSKAEGWLKVALMAKNFSRQEEEALEELGTAPLPVSTQGEVVMAQAAFMHTHADRFPIESIGAKKDGDGWVLQVKLAPDRDSYEVREEIRERIKLRVMFEPEKDPDPIVE